MKLVIKVLGESQPLINALTDEGIAAKLMRGGVLITPEYDDTVGGYHIPECVEPKGCLFLIDCAECGGGMTNTGDSVIVCSFRGKKLTPYYIPRKGHLSNGVHAYFSIPNVVTTIRGFRNDPNIDISVHKVLVSGRAVQIVSRRVWSGEIGILPRTYECYRQAAIVAEEKANCYHCRSPHYYEPRVERVGDYYEQGV